MYIQTPLLYLAVILTWGCSWYAVKIQAGYLPVTQLISYRFLLAFALLFILLKSRRALKKLKPIQHFHCLLLGATLFSFNYYTFYHSTPYITSGLMAVIFSLAPIINSINSYLWFKALPNRFTILGSLLGLGGVTLLFLPDIQNDFSNTNLWWSIFLCILGTSFFSTGNMLSSKINTQENHLPSTTCWAMLYGAIMMLILNFILQEPLIITTLPTDFTFISSMLYLAIFASIVAFLSYLELVNRIGASKAAYTTIVIPTIAIFISVWLEDYQWYLSTIIGLVFIGLGNIIIFKKRSQPSPT